MKTYLIVKLLTVAAGTVVRLSAEQAQRRRGRVTDLGEGRYQLNELLQFKAGEVVGIEGDLPKVHLEYVQEQGGETIAPPSGEHPEPAATRPLGHKKK